jgi:hypothetical protein
MQSLAAFYLYIYIIKSSWFRVPKKKVVDLVSCFADSIARQTIVIKTAINHNFRTLSLKLLAKDSVFKSLVSVVYQFINIPPSYFLLLHNDIEFLLQSVLLNRLFFFSSVPTIKNCFPLLVASKMKSQVQMKNEQFEQDL